ncbi:hypothetical protein ACFFLS_16080 [Flavobacterium procerum]|uniref:Uncharacterized protein n=1 Tax=Flavobacterium procerum TaxID=1455569 RepID=A0ABV6BWZ9_9FLAO
MKKYFSTFFYSFSKPVLFWIVSIFLMLLSSNFNNPLVINICFWIFCVGLLGLLIGAFFQLSQRKWLKAFISLFLFGLSIFLLIVIAIVGTFIADERPDTWAKNLTIPKNIQIDNPVDLNFGSNFESQRPDSITNRVVTKTEFQLYNSFQRGIYEYDFWIGKIESGTIYLKAYEITHNEALSANDLSRTSSIQIYNSSDSIKKFSTKDDFTIYEGDWGDPYAARFEVWFKPDNGKPERKLFSKNYKIEGWMR